MNEEISKCQTQAELAEFERIHVLNEEQQRLVFERRLEIFRRIARWRTENQEVGLEPTIFILDFWTLAQREQFLSDWNDNEAILESPQTGRGQKRTFEEINRLIM